MDEKELIFELIKIIGVGRAILTVFVITSFPILANIVTDIVKGIIEGRKTSKEAKILEKLSKNIEEVKVNLLKHMSTTDNLLINFDEDQKFMAEAIERLVEAISIINQKVDHNLTKKDAVNLTYLTTKGLLLLNVSELLMEFTIKMEKYGSNENDLKNQFVLLTNNAINRYIKMLDGFSTKQKVGALILSSYFKEDSSQKKFIDNLIDLTFNKNFDRNWKYQRLVAEFESLTEVLTTIVENNYDDAVIIKEV